MPRQRTITEIRKYKRMIHIQFTKFTNILPKVLTNLTQPAYGGDKPNTESAHGGSKPRRAPVVKRLLLCDPVIGSDPVPSGPIR